MLSVWWMPIVGITPGCGTSTRCGHSSGDEVHVKDGPDSESAGDTPAVNGPKNLSLKSRRIRISSEILRFVADRLCNAVHTSRADRPVSMRPGPRRCSEWHTFRGTTAARSFLIIAEPGSSVAASRAQPEIPARPLAGHRPPCNAVRSHR